MEPLRTLKSRVVPLLRDDVDTDQIIPARFLTVTDKLGLGRHLFSAWREDPSFILNRSDTKGAEVLLAGKNFGCGSSREHAPWALLDFGFRAIVARSFADIFRNNALKNGLLTIALDEATHRNLVRQVESSAGAEIEASVSDETIRLPSGAEFHFPIDPFAKKCLVEGKDQMEYLLAFDAAISGFETQRARHV